jgi:hypothetical protein
MVGRYFSKFNAGAVAEKFYERWKRSPSSQYYETIRGVLDRGGDDAAAKRQILAQWGARGEAASEAGTRMHADAELLCNDILPAEGAHSPEMRQLRSWLREFEPQMKWTPVRTEWSLYLEDERSDELVVAGTLDLLLWSKMADAYMIVDFKRTDPAPKRAGWPLNLLGEGGSAHGRYGRMPFGNVKDDDFGKYTVQLNSYAHILRHRYGIYVTELMLLQLHPDLQTAHHARAPLLLHETNAMFAIETERLMEERIAAREAAMAASRGAREEATAALSTAQFPQPIW